MYLGTNAVMLGCRHVGFHPVGGAGTSSSPLCSDASAPTDRRAGAEWGQEKNESWCFHLQRSVTFIPMLPSRTLAKHPNSHFSADQSRTNFCRSEPATGHFKSYSRWFLKEASALKGTEVLSPQKHVFFCPNTIHVQTAATFLLATNIQTTKGRNIRWRLCRCCRLHPNYSREEITGPFEGSQTVSQSSAEISSFSLLCRRIFLIFWEENVTHLPVILLIFVALLFHSLYSTMSDGLDYCLLPEMKFTPFFGFAPLLTSSLSFNH